MPLDLMRRAKLSGPAVCGLNGWSGLFLYVLPNNWRPGIDGFRGLVLRENGMGDIGVNRDHFSLLDTEDPVMYLKKQFTFQNQGNLFTLVSMFGKAATGFYLKVGQHRLI